MKTAIKLYIVDDHPFFRQGVRFYLETFDDVEIVGEADNGQKALEAIGALLKGDDLIWEDLVVLMDLQMPVMDGIETTRALLALNNGLRILVLTSQGDSQAVQEVMTLGAAGFCLKDAPPQELENAIRSVHGGGAYLGKGVLPHLLNQEKAGQTENRRTSTEALPKGTMESPAEEALLDSLTPREREVLVLLARGLSNKAIGEALFVSEKTVKTHAANVFGKLMVTSRTQAALWAQQQGLDKEEIR